MYHSNIRSKEVLSKNVVSGNYYCEQAKVKYSTSAATGNATMTVYTYYTPNFKCSTDGNGKGIINSSIGLITYDEMVYSGGYRFAANENYYLFNGIGYMSMSPAATYDSGRNAGIWFNSKDFISDNGVQYASYALRPVINLKSDIQKSSGDGTKDSPFVVE